MLKTVQIIDGKAQDNIFKKFEKAIPKWMEFIEISLVSDNFKKEYREIIIKKNTSLFFWNVNFRCIICSYNTKLKMDADEILICVYFNCSFNYKIEPVFIYLYMNV